MVTIEERMKAALTADGEDLWRLVRDTHPDVISNVVLNRDLTEDMAVFIAGRRTTSSETLGFLANDVRFKDSYKLKRAICKNPATQQRVTLSLLKFLGIFDLADVIKDQHININIRRKIEFLLLEKTSSMPSGVKTALARRANSNILISLMESGDEKVIGTCLESPALTEALLYKLINKPATKAAVVGMIAEHGKWSLRYYVRYALIRNYHTPMSAVLRFIKSMKSTDLKDLYADPELPTSTKPFIFSELLERKETTEVQATETFSLSGDEDL
jgi:hypothetical protein